MSNSKQHIPLALAAQRLSVPWGTAHRYILTGKLKGHFVNGRWQVEETSLNALIQQSQERDRVAVAH
jgi:predicted site-specific integrase-resolvase